MPSLAGWIGHNVRSTFLDVESQPQRIGVIGDDEKVERPAELDGQPRGGPDFLATGKPVRILGRQRVPEQARVEGVSRVQVRLAPVNLAGKCALRIGRVRLARIQLAGFGVLDMGIYLGKHASRRTYRCQAQGRQGCDGFMRLR